MARRFTDNPDYVEYERLALRLRTLISEGHGDSAEAATVRDQMDGLWRRLDTDELARLTGLSADLEMLGDEEVFESASPTELHPQTLGVALLDARDAGDWEAVLALLRKGPAFLSGLEVALLRAEAYDELRHPDAARLFIRHAVKLSVDEVGRKIFDS